MADGDFIIGTDVAHFVLFHPADLAHRADDPIAWYAYDFAYSRESRAGRLIAWGTGSDGGYRVRLTSDGLTEAEQNAACASWAFPYVVRHGLVLLDNTDALPGEERMTDPKAATTWYEIANGSYRVTVTPIDRSQDTSLPDYVVQFDPVMALAWVPAAPTPPDLRPFPDWEARPGASMELESRFAWPTRPIETEGLPLLVVGEDIAALPMLTTSLPVCEAVAELAFPERFSDGADVFAIAVSATPGQLCVLGRRSGLSQSGEALPVLRLHGAGIGRIAAIRAGEGPVPVADVAALEAPAMAVDPATAAAFRQRLEDAAADGRLTASSFERERLAAFSAAEAMTSWALMRIGLPLGQRLGIYALSAKERIKAIDDALA